jgi:hypothetical protein
MLSLSRNIEASRGCKSGVGGWVIASLRVAQGIVGSA